jgi:RNA polymerase sigma factor FliA
MNDMYPTERRQAEESLWSQFVASPSEACLAALLEHYMPMVRGIVRDFHLCDRADLDEADVLQVAMMGLVEAIHRYDPARGVLFRSFALRRIKGAVLDLLRRADVLSRRDREEWTRIQAAISAHLAEHGCMPADEELAAGMGLSLSQVQKLMVRVKSVLSLDVAFDASEDGRGGCLLDTIVDENIEAPLEAVIREERYAAFRAAFRKLDDRAQKILYLYYYEELTLREIGQIMELTEARICQIHAKSLLGLKVMLEQGQDVA